MEKKDLSQVMRKISKLKKLYDERIYIYRETADVIVPDMATSKEEAEYIITNREELCYENTCD